MDSFLNVLLALACAALWLGSSVIFLSVFGVTVIARIDNLSLAPLARHNSGRTTGLGLFCV